MKITFVFGKFVVPSMYVSLRKISFARRFLHFMASTTILWCLIKPVDFTLESVLNEAMHVIRKTNLRSHSAISLSLHDHRASVVSHDTFA